MSGSARWLSVERIDISAASARHASSNNNNNNNNKYIFLPSQLA